MAKKADEVILGFDVGQENLDVYGTGFNREIQIRNRKAAIRDYLGQLAVPVSLAVEATNDYHEPLIEIATELGMTVYLVDGYRLSHYREVVGTRAKTDRSDARLIYRYLQSERALLRPLSLQNREERLIWRLLKRRAKVVKLRTQLELSLRQVDVPAADQAHAMAGLDQLIRKLTDQAKQLAHTANWGESLTRLRTIPGIGELSALGLRALYGRGEFANADRFIAFLGLDVRVRDSGCYRGRRKLTKRGDPEIRRLLFNGARSVASRYDYWRDLKASHLSRGLSEIQSSVVISRKLARIGFAILRDGTEYQPVS